MDVLKEAEFQGRIEALARQRNIALDEAVFHAGRYKALQTEMQQLQGELTKKELEIADLERILDLVGYEGDAGITVDQKLAEADAKPA